MMIDVLQLKQLSRGALSRKLKLRSYLKTCFTQRDLRSHTETHLYYHYILHTSQYYFLLFFIMTELMQEKKVNTYGAKSAQSQVQPKIFMRRMVVFSAKFKLTPYQIELCGKSCKKTKIVGNMK